MNLFANGYTTECPESQLKIETCDTHGEYPSRSFSITGAHVMWSGCEACEAEESEKREQEKIATEEARNFAIKQNQLSEMSLPKRYWNIDLDNYSPTAAQESAYSKAKSFVDNFDRDNSQVLILAGTTGTGKTRLASAIMQSLEFGKYLRAIDISRLVRNTFGNSELSEYELIERIVDFDLLIIDEVGVQSGTNNEQMLITDIIDRRYAELKSTIIVSNLDKSNLAKSFGARAWDRINQDAVFSAMTGESLRVNS